MKFWADLKKEHKVKFWANLVMLKSKEKVYVVYGFLQAVPGGQAVTSDNIYQHQKSDWRILASWLVNAICVIKKSAFART